MEVMPIQPNLSFESRKRRFIDSESHSQLEQILNKMDSETIYKSNAYSFESTRTKKLFLINKNKYIELVDTRKRLNNFPPNQQMQGHTLLTIGKTELVIDNKSGEIIDYSKPLLKTWKNITSQIQMVLAQINSLYNNPDCVKKYKLSLSGFTQKGINLLNKIKVK